MMVASRNKWEWTNGMENRERRRKETCMVCFVIDMHARKMHGVRDREKGRRAANVEWKIEREE